METKPHIGKGGDMPGDFGYKFDCELTDCTFRMHSLDGRDPQSGVLEIVPPEGKVAHLQILRLIKAAPMLNKALRDLLQVALSRGERLGLDDRGPVLDNAKEVIAYIDGLAPRTVYENFIKERGEA